LKNNKPSPSPIESTLWCKYFSDLYASFDRGIVVDTTVDTGSFLWVDTLDTPFSITEVSEAINKLKNGKSVGIDGIGAEVWKNSEKLIPILREIFNVCFSD
jgi:hypothetical protein